MVYLIRSLVTSQQPAASTRWGLHLRFVDEPHQYETSSTRSIDRGTVIREAVVNLMSNAMRYTDEDGWVTVTVRAAADKSDVLICCPAIPALALPPRT